MLGIRLGILKFSELAIFILNQEINHPVQPPPAKRLERATSQEVALFVSFFWLSEDVTAPRAQCMSRPEAKGSAEVTAFDMGQHPGDAASKNRRVEQQFARELWATPSA
ncbi:hypothetical protein ACK3Y8_07185 [Aeromonas caviae]